jgi:hypothetical protein
MMEEDRVRLTRVRSPQQDQLRLFSLLVRAGATARAEYRRQPGDAGRVSRTVAAVDVVAADDAPRKLLSDEVRLVRALRAAEETEGAGTVPVHDAPQSGRGAVERLVPRGRAKTARAFGLADERLREPGIRTSHADIPLRTLVRVTHREASCETAVASLMAAVRTILCFGKYSQIAGLIICPNVNVIFAPAVTFGAIGRYRV